MPLGLCASLFSVFMSLFVHFVSLRYLVPHIHLWLFKTLFVVLNPCYWFLCHLESFPGYVSLLVLSSFVWF